VTLVAVEAVTACGLAAAAGLLAARASVAYPLSEFAVVVALLALLAAGLAASLLQRDPPGLTASVLAVAAGLVLSLLIIRWEDLVALVESGPGAPEQWG
jgi:hypothetical protein